MEQFPKPPFERILFVCCNERQPGEDACANRGSAELQKKLKELAAAKGLKGRLRVSRSLCLGQCAIGPNVCVYPDNVWYHHVTEADLPEIMRKWIEPMEPR
jgi:(2Fe-2S) ferredoxin